MGNSMPTGTQEKKMKSCKYVHPNIVSNVKICVDSKSARENSVIYVCLAGIGHSPEYPTKKHRCLIIYHIELIDVIEGQKVLSTPQHTQYYIAKPNYWRFSFS